MNDELIDLVVHDPLTGIYNRRYFETSMKKSISSYMRSRSPFQIILFVIDHFKGINDTYGHPCGDYILKELTRLINSEIGDKDTFARIGGEEFAIILSQSNLEEIEEISQRIRQRVEQMRQSNKTEVLLISNGHHRR
ncbi:GGDEF domain-containing protein [Paenibacillus humicus]|uniref:GGDEF domain-containing protein n=1 Tax=Paenibacillus humicus TaxID=412861 RepID=UPI003D27D543